MLLDTTPLESRCQSGDNLSMKRDRRDEAKRLASDIREPNRHIRLGESGRTELDNVSATWMLLAFQMPDINPSNLQHRDP